MARSPAGMSKGRSFVHGATVVVVVSLTTAVMVMGTSQALATHVSCGDTITQDTTLDADLVDCPGDGVVIGADDVTLNLNGYTVDGDETRNDCDAGVANGKALFGCPESAAQAFDGVTVTNGVVRQFATGIEVHTARDNVVRVLAVSDNDVGVSLRGAVASRIEGNRLSGNRFAGAQVSNESDSNDRTGRNQIQRNWIAGNANGIYLEASDGNLIRGNSLRGNPGAGVSLDGATSNLIERNAVSGSCDAVSLHHSQRNQLNRNALTDNQCNGVEATDGARDNVYERNRVAGNAGIGLAVEESLVVANSALQNGAAGILMYCCGRIEGNFSRGNDAGIVVYGANHLEGNRVIENAQDGILVEDLPWSSGQGLLSRNVAKRNGDDGMDVNAPATTLRRNVANDNLDLGIEAVPGVTDAGGNRATGNGNELECSNVRCR